MLLCLALLAIGCWTSLHATELRIQGTQFAVNGKPTFLLGISYYGGLGAPTNFVSQDLDDIQRAGFNWIRLWATWSGFTNDISAVNPLDGKPREPFFDRLKWIVAECDRRGLIVDVTLSRGDGSASATRVDSLEKHLRVVATLVTALKPYHNWYLDLSNERDVRDKRFTSFDDLKQLRDELKRLDPGRLVTASSGSDVSHNELRGYIQTAQLDFICPHRPRSPKSAAETERKTRELFDWMNELGRVVPIHYQEPFRRGYTDWQPKAQDFVADAVAAKKGGAAGWCFHNGSERRSPEQKPRRSFDLREKRLFDQLDSEELAAVKQLQSAF
jgi:hypothetical protein